MNVLDKDEYEEFLELYHQNSNANTNTRVKSKIHLQRGAYEEQNFEHAIKSILLEIKVPRSAPKIILKKSGLMAINRILNNVAFALIKQSPKTN